MAWIGIADTKQKTISLVESEVVPEEDKHLFANVRYDNNGPQDRAMTKGKYYVCNDIENDLETSNWKPYAQRHNVNSCIVFPFRKNGAIIGTFNLYATSTDYFNEKEIALLKEVTGDISFALDVFEKEKAKELAESKLQHNELHLNQAQAVAHVGSWERNFVSGILLLSPEACRIMGFDPKDNEQTYESWIAVVHPDDLEYVKETTTRARESNSRNSFDHRILRADGSIRHLHNQSEIQYNEAGEAVGLYGVIHDVTERVHAAAKLQDSERRFRSLIEHSEEAVIILSADVTPLYISPALQQVIGYTDEEGMNMDLLLIIHPDDISQISSLITNVLNHPELPIGYQCQVKHKDGSWRWIDGMMTNMLHDKAINGIIDNFRDVTAKKHAEEKMLRATQLYSFISQVNQAIVHVNNEDALFNEVCRIALKYGKFKFAWIGKIDKVQKTVTLRVHCGFTEELTKFFAHNTYLEQGPTSQVLQTNGYYLCNNTENGEALPEMKTIAEKYCYKSFMILPIKVGGATIGIFNLHSEKAHHFDVSEIALLEEVASDISFAMEVFEKDKENKKANLKLANSEFRLNQAQGIAHLGSWSLNVSNGDGVWSEEACKIYGLEKKENKRSLKLWFSFVHPDDLEIVKRITRDAEAMHTDTSFYHRIVRKDGAIRYIHSQIQFEVNNSGKTVGLHGVCHDITEQRENIMQLKEQNKKLTEIGWIQSHKVRGPLATILGLAHLFKDDIPGIPVKEIIDGILISSEKLDVVIREIVSNTEAAKTTQGHADHI